jgi:hypothetical protein
MSSHDISDLPGIPREVIEHKLGMDSAFKPIKQKERRYTPERRETIWLRLINYLKPGSSGQYIILAG